MTASTSWDRRSANATPGWPARNPAAAWSRAAAMRAEIHLAVGWVDSGMACDESIPVRCHNVDRMKHGTLTDGLGCVTVLPWLKSSSVPSPTALTMTR